MGYRKYNYMVKPLGKNAYWPRADDPRKIVCKALRDVVDATRTWRLAKVRDAYTQNPEGRPAFFSQKQGSRPVFGATIFTPEQAEDVPGGTNESDIQNLLGLNAEWADQATHENTKNRIMTLLSMLGDIELVDSNTSWRYSGTKHSTVFKVKGQTLILLGEK